MPRHRPLSCRRAQRLGLRTAGTFGTPQRRQARPEGRSAKRLSKYPQGTRRTPQPAAADPPDRHQADEARRAKTKAKTKTRAPARSLQAGARPRSPQKATLTPFSRAAARQDRVSTRRVSRATTRPAEQYRYSCCNPPRAQFIADSRRRRRTARAASSDASTNGRPALC